MSNVIRSFVRRDESGQTYIEYGLIVSLVGVALIGILLIVGGDVGGEFNHIKDRVVEAL